VRTPDELFEQADKHLIKADGMPPGPAASTLAAVAQAEILLGVTIRADEDEDDSEDTQRD
jgi:hypothetical protein